MTQQGSTGDDQARPIAPWDGVRPSGGRRFLDVTVAVMGLLLLSLPMLLLYLLVRVSSPGPGIFRQPRVGQGGRPFTMYKFRTMHTGATGLAVTARCDPRLTKVGKLLREWSLDELPQLWNVLRGDMTLVGPRPETFGLAERYTSDCRWIFDHRPGLTGVSEVRLRDFEVLGPGNEVDLDGYLHRIVPARLSLDAVYLRDPSMRLTFQTLFDTVRHILGFSVPPLKGGPDHRTLHINPAVQPPNERRS